MIRFIFNYVQEILIIVHGDFLLDKLVNSCSWLGQCIETIAKRQRATAVNIEMVSTRKEPIVPTQQEVLVRSPLCPHHMHCTLLHPVL